MSIDVFDQLTFEQALPIHKETGEKLWYCVGLVQNEITYRIPIVEGQIEIELRSSIKPNGYSAGTGKDSIRAWLVGADGKPLGSKISKWTTRLPGWEDRMLDVLRELWDRAKWAGYYPDCKVPNGVFKVKKAGPNKGRIFKKCTNCNNHFEWRE